jgi:hypothetical protein
MKAAKPGATDREDHIGIDAALSMNVDDTFCDR